MTARQPFTALCQKLSRPRQDDRADLHVHTTCSDGAYTPFQVVDLARRSGLPALAVTDHDTLAGIAPARAAAGETLEIVPGVEITAEYRQRPLHLLGYFFQPEDPALAEALAELRRRRAERFMEMVQRLRQIGIPLEEAKVQRALSSVPGRRHLAQMLVEGRWAGNIHEAFARYLGDGGRIASPGVGLPVPQAIALVRNAGGVAAWAHPTYDCSRDHLHELRQLGLQAVEVDFPHCATRRSRELRRLAQELGLAVTGGSDCHGPDARHNALGSHGVSRLELNRLRERATAVV